MIGLQKECGGSIPPSSTSSSLIMTSSSSENNNSSSTSSSSSSTPISSTNIGNLRNGVMIGGTTRERTMHAIEYYNSNVLRARVGAGLAGTRSSVNERHNYNGKILTHGNRLYQHNDNIYRSNSSLELIHDHNSVHHDSIVNGNGGNLRREYGSHGSIDIISSDRQQTSGENFLSMLQEYQSPVLNMSRGNNERRDHQEHSTAHNHTVPDGGNGGVSGISSASPKLRNKLNRLWPHSGANKSGRSQQPQCQTQSVTNTIDDNSIVSLNSSLNLSTTSTTVSTSSADIEERQRRRAFAHYDCQSLTANLGYAAKLRGLLLARRRNTTTGASAAAMYGTRSSTPDGDSVDEDYGDGQDNELLENCPFFRNEVGGEEEREVSLTRMQSPLPVSGQQRRAIHRPSLAYGVSLLECLSNESLWDQVKCSYKRSTRPIEQVDNGARYYRQYFLGQDHQNWFGMDEQLGPVAISIKKEKLPLSSNSITHHDNTSNNHTNLFRLIVRTSELLTLRGSVIEDSIPNARGPGKNISTKEVLEYVAPEVQIQCLRLGVSTPQCEQQLLKLDEQGLTNKYKVGVLYCRAGQSSEEDMYNNEDAGPAFTEFLETIGNRVRLKGFENYKAGLDNKTDSTGTNSVYATYRDCEIMFHVSTMLPFTPNNRQQLLRKRHIGNDIVTIVFQEPGALPFSPKNIRSQFQHVFLIVRAVNPCTENTQYRVAVSRSKEVPVFGPPICLGAMYNKNKSFADFLLAKVINAENAAHRSEKFATMATRTRQEYLKDLSTNYCTASVVETGQKFSIFPSKKRERTKPRFSGDLIQRGAFCWQVVLHDSGLSAQVDCFLGISAETFVLIEECTRQIIFVTACKFILGWSTNGNSLRIYHHQGECVTLNMRDSGDRDEQLEVIERLRAVTTGCGALELSLRRNPMGQLGFHVQPDGIVTQVEYSGQAWTAGLRQGCRLVEICKVAVATLSHDQMVDLLKTSAQVTVTVIESYADYSPRRGCLLQNCRFNAINYESDYESYEWSDQNVKKNIPVAQIQQASANNRIRYGRNMSPPRSSNSSGYGTGSSSRSFTAINGVQQNETRYVPDMGTLTSSSSGHSSNDERWYDVLETHDNSHPVNNNHDGSQNQHQQSQQQQPIYNHPKLTHASNSLPLVSSNSSRPLSVHDSRPLPRTANIEYLVTRAPKIQDYVTSSDVLMKSLHISEPPEKEYSVDHPEPLYSTAIKNSMSHSNTDDEELNGNVNGISEVQMLKRSATANQIYNKKTTNGGTVSSSASSSRNNSPRPHTEAKLRSGVTNRNGNIVQRNSVNYTGSSLQEDLMKLINPDYMVSNDDNFNQGGLPANKPQKNIQNSHSLGNISNMTQLKPALMNDDLLLLKKKSRSREGINLGQNNINGNLKIMNANGSACNSSSNSISSSNNNSSNSNTNSNSITNSNNNNNNTEGTTSEVIFTTARPATVISTPSNSSSPASELGNKSHHHSNDDHSNKSSPRKMNPGILKNNSGIITNNGNGTGTGSNLNKLPLLPDMKDMDWSVLVDTATKAMMQVSLVIFLRRFTKNNIY